MLRGVLRSSIAVQVNIHIMRAFVAIRQYALHHKTLANALTELEQSTDERFNEVGQVLDALLEQKQQQEDFANRKRIGYK